MSPLALVDGDRDGFPPALRSRLRENEREVLLYPRVGCVLYTEPPALENKALCSELNYTRTKQKKRFALPRVDSGTNDENFRPAPFSQSTHDSPKEITKKTRATARQPRLFEQAAAVGCWIPA